MKNQGSLREIVRGKAEFLIYTKIEIAKRMHRAQMLRIEASDIPTGRKASRERAEALRREATDIVETLANELGHSVLGTFCFVKDLQRHLTKKQKRKLL